MISVRSEVQVFPGPPAFAALQLWARQAFLERRLLRRSASEGERERAFVFWYGAIAQLGERVLCKHEVVGSIPSGSTSLRWLRQLRLGKPIVAKAVEAKTPIIVRETSLRTRCPDGQ